MHTSHVLPDEVTPTPNAWSSNDDQPPRRLAHPLDPNREGPTPPRTAAPQSRPNTHVPDGRWTTKEAGCICPGVGTLFSPDSSSPARCDQSYAEPNRQSR